MNKVLFDITGMNCSACAARIEKGVSKFNGINEVSVNLLKNSMSVSFNDEIIDANQIIKNVDDMGYGATIKTVDTKKQESKTSYKTA